MIGRTGAVGPGRPVGRRGSTRPIVGPVVTGGRHQPLRRGRIVRTTGPLVLALGLVWSGSQPVVGPDQTVPITARAATGGGLAADETDVGTAMRPATEPARGPDPVRPTPSDGAGRATTGEADAAVPIDPADPADDETVIGQPWGDQVEGLLTFRGNPTRTFHGRGPIPTDPAITWRHPSAGALCGLSTVGAETREWCGTGWTGQPGIVTYEGRELLFVGAYDHQLHVLDPVDGTPVMAPLRTGDLVKGSVTIDPDGYPLAYIGSRDDRYRVVGFDGGELTELWTLHANDGGPTMWNNDWDGAGLVIDDHLLIGGENSRFHIVELNRAYDAEGRVTVDPRLVVDVAGWDDQLLADIGDRNVSIEGSVAVHDDVVYFANSGGLVQGWDLAGWRAGGELERVFRYWVGDDTDASVVIDDEGHLYIAVEWERYLPRAQEVGQVLKLDPGASGDPLLWSFNDPAEVPGTDAGAWATPGLVDGVVIVPLNSGQIVGLDGDDGTELWSVRLAGPTWSSPVIVDDVWIQGDCAGVLRGFDVSDPRREPNELWSVDIGGCIESTPAVWGGGIYVGTRAGQVVGIHDR